MSRDCWSRDCWSRHYCPHSIIRCVKWALVFLKTKIIYRIATLFLLVFPTSNSWNLPPSKFIIEFALAKNRVSIVFHLVAFLSYLKVRPFYKYSELLCVVINGLAFWNSPSESDVQISPIMITTNGLKAIAFC